MTGYLSGQTTLTTQQKVTQLQKADNATTGQSTAVVPPSSGTGQNIPNPNTPAANTATPLNPTQTITNVTTEPRANPAATPNGVGLDKTVYLGTGGVATLAASTFQVRYKDKNNVPLAFNFSLLPAVETNLRSNHMGAMVPEVKPGILVRTSMNYKKFAIPGAGPAFQSLGIDQTILQIVGLFVGTEGVTSTPPDSAIYGRYGDTLKLISANTHAETFDRDVVKSGKEVTIYLSSAGSDTRDTMSMQYKCCIQNFRVFVVRYDRVYYAMDAVLTEYPIYRIADVKSPEAEKAGPPAPAANTPTGAPPAKEVYGPPAPGAPATADNLSSEPAAPPPGIGDASVLSGEPAAPPAGLGTAQSLSSEPAPPPARPTSSPQSAPKTP